MPLNHASSGPQFKTDNYIWPRPAVNISRRVLDTKFGKHVCSSRVVYRWRSRRRVNHTDTCVGTLYNREIADAHTETSQPDPMLARRNAVESPVLLIHFTVDSGTGTG